MIQENNLRIKSVFTADLRLELRLTFTELWLVYDWLETWFVTDFNQTSVGLFSGLTLISLDWLEVRLVLVSTNLVGLVLLSFDLRLWHWDLTYDVNKTWDLTWTWLEPTLLPASCSGFPLRHVNSSLENLLRVELCEGWWMTSSYITVSEL